jgi:hypothetical protein
VGAGVGAVGIGGFAVPGSAGSEGYYRGRTRRGSVSGYDDDTYARGRRHSRSPLPGQAPLYTPSYAGRGASPIPVSAPVAMSSPVVYGGGSAPYGGSSPYGGGGSPYGGGGSPYGGGSSAYGGGGSPYRGGGSPYGGSAQAYPTAQAYATAQAYPNAQTYPSAQVYPGAQAYSNTYGGAYPVGSYTGQYGAPTSATAEYAAHYGGTAAPVYAYGQHQPQQPVVVLQGSGHRGHHRHRSHSHLGGRHRSLSGYGQSYAY